MKKLNLQKILVPIDFSERSIHAIAAARNVARRFGSTISLVNVHEFDYPTGFLIPAAPIPVSPMAYFEDAHKAVEQGLKELSRSNALGGKCYARVGVPIFDEICSVARRAGVDMIVTSTHGHTGLKHLFLGSTAERLVQHAPCPVLVARDRKLAGTRGKRRSNGKGDSLMSVNTILVPVDFSACSLAGLSYAIQFAEKFSARLILLHVVNVAVAISADGCVLYDISAVEMAAREDAKERMADFVRWAQFGRVQYATVVKVGQTVKTICDFVGTEKVDLVITSTHGRTGFKHVMLGSIAEQVVRSASCSVLTVPSHPDVRGRHLSDGIQRAEKSKQKEVLDLALSRDARKRRPAKKELKASMAPAAREMNKARESHRLLAAPQLFYQVF
jgi:nucleotide-binding universal stress UspA family protein